MEHHEVEPDVQEYDLHPTLEPEVTNEEPQPDQTDSSNQQPSRSPRNYPPQPSPQQFPPQPAYNPTAQFVQAPAQRYPPQPSPQAYSKAPPTSPYNPTAAPPGVNYQNGAPAMYQDGGYAAQAAQVVQANGVPAPGYPQRSPYHYQVNQGTVGWSTGLFDCMDDPTNALITACCPCFTFGQVAEIVDSGHTTCATSGILYGVIAAFTLVPCLISCTYRTKIRNQYDLVEVPAADWLTHCFCEWCALCQEYRELKNRGFDPAIGWHGNMMRNQQQPQVVMMPPVNQTMSDPHAAV